MRDNGTKIKCKGMEFLSRPMEELMLDNFLWTKNRDMVVLVGQMEDNSEDFGKRDINKEREFILMRKGR